MSAVATPNLSDFVKSFAHQSERGPRTKHVPTSGTQILCCGTPLQDYSRHEVLKSAGRVDALPKPGGWPPPPCPGGGAGVALAF